MTTKMKKYIKTSRLKYNFENVQQTFQSDATNRNAM